MQPGNKKEAEKDSRTLRSLVQIIRYAFLYIFLFTANASYALTKNTSILILNQSNNVFSKKLIGNIKSKIHDKHDGIKIDEKKLNDNPGSNKLLEYDFIITLGNKPAEYALKKNIKKPVLSLLITKKAIELLNKTYNPDHAWSTISLDQPIKRQLLLIKHLLGKNKTIGTIFGPYSQKHQKNFIETAASLGLKLIYKNTTVTDQLISSLKSLTSRSDLILAIPDPVAFNRKTIRGILLLTYRRGIPVIGFSKSYVKAGALSAVYSTADQISRQAAEIINNRTDSKSFESKNFEPKYFSIAINKQVARTLGIKKINIDKIIKLIKHDENLK